MMSLNPKRPWALEGEANTIFKRPKNEIKTKIIKYCRHYIRQDDIIKCYYSWVRKMIHCPSL